jgi:fumarate reductase (CoM/CoB) subunit B
MKETIDKCSNCGFCKSHCPTFRVLLEEPRGARGRANLVRKAIDTEIYYMCTLCGACRVTCPEGIDLPEEIRLMRVKMVADGKTPKAFNEMIKNIREHGNAFGKVEKGTMPKDLYCC